MIPLLTAVDALCLCELLNTGGAKTPETDRRSSMRFRGSPFQLSTPRAIGVDWFIRAMRTPLREPWAVFLFFFFFFPPKICSQFVIVSGAVTWFQCMPFFFLGVVDTHPIRLSVMPCRRDSVLCIHMGYSSACRRWLVLTHSDSVVAFQAEWTGELAQTVVISVHRPDFWNCPWRAPTRTDITLCAIHF